MKVDRARGYVNPDRGRIWMMQMEIALVVYTGFFFVRVGIDWRYRDCGCAIWAVFCELLFVRCGLCTVGCWLGRRGRRRERDGCDAEARGIGDVVAE